LTGSYVHSDKPVAIFSGHQRATLPISLTNVPEFSSRDCLIEEMPPLNVWGKNAFLTPFAPGINQDPSFSDLYRILAGYDSTVVSINGTKVATLMKGQFNRRFTENCGFGNCVKPDTCGSIQKDFRIFIVQVPIP